MADLPQNEAPKEPIDEKDLAQLLRSFRCPFGPTFFLEQLTRFLRDRCPEPTERLPHVELWVGGEPMTVCHIVAIAPAWVAVAVRDRNEESEMRTELIPYETIARVTLGAPVARTRGVGFDAEHKPVVLESVPTPAAMLTLASQPPGG